MTDWSQLADLAAERLGGAVLAANDDFFAPKENLLKAAAPVFDPDRYTDRGKWMDGWETRRRREPGHDWCLVRLGLPGVIRGVVVDTAHFKGNYPEACSLEACYLPGHPGVEILLDPSTPWTEILPRSPLAGDSRNPFAIDSPWRFSHLRLRIYPDGGVARLRVHGEVVPELATVGRPEVGLDLAAVAHGGRVLAASDLFFSHPAHLLLPGPATHMGDGWETRRRRGPGHDWVLLALAGAGEIAEVEVDTSHFKGNAPGSCSLAGIHAPGATAEDLAERAEGWSEILPRTALQPHTRHRFRREVAAVGPVTHARFAIYPDGGVGRLRLAGRLSRDGRVALGLRDLDTLVPEAARAGLLACCGASRWAEEMARARPFGDLEQLLASADQVGQRLGREDWLEAFAAHPQIGEGKAARATGATAARWSGEEQAGTRAAGEEVRARLAAGNRAYEERFGHIFIVRASGRSAEEMLALLEARLTNDPDTELRVAVAEQAEITRLRLEKLVGA